MKEVPCIIADDLTEEQIKAYRLADNKVSELAEWDIDLLSGELEDIFDIDMSDFGFDLSIDEEEVEVVERQLYQQPEGTAEAEAVQETPAVQNEPQAEATEHVEPEPQTIVKAEEPPRRDDEVAYWKQRFATVQGMLNSQSAQFGEQLRLANDRIQALTTDLESVRKASAAEPPRSNDNDAEVFGEDLVGAIDRRAEQKARALVAQETQQLMAYVKQLEAKLGNVGEQVAESTQDRFYNRLAALVPDYEAVN